LVLSFVIEEILSCEDCANKEMNCFGERPQLPGVAFIVQRRKPRREERKEQGSSSSISATSSR